MNTEVQGELTTSRSRDEMATMSARLEDAADDLERQGMDRVQIGAGMVGFGMALLDGHAGRGRTLEVIDAIRDAILSENPSS